jgi:hypothetical protein
MRVATPAKERVQRKFATVLLGPPRMAFDIARKDQSAQSACSKAGRRTAELSAFGACVFERPLPVVAA